MPQHNSMIATLKDENYEGFEHSITEVKKYIRAGDIFTILLKDKRIIHHTIDIKEAGLFEKWLTAHNIVNIKLEPKKG